MADKTGNKFKDITADNDYSVANNTEKTETVIHTAEERKRMNDDDNNTEKRLYITMLKNNAIIIKSKSGKSLLNDLRKMAYARFRTLLNQMCDCNFNKKIIMDTFKQKHRHAYLINLYGIKGSKEYGGIEKAPKSNVYKVSYLAYAPFVFYNNFNGKNYFYIEMHYKKQIRCILAEDGKLTTKELNAYIIADSNDERFFRNSVVASRRIAINNASLKYPYRYSWSDFWDKYDYCRNLRKLEETFKPVNECSILETMNALNILTDYNLVSLFGMLCAPDLLYKNYYNDYYLWTTNNNTAYQLAKKIISLSNYQYMKFDGSNIKDINALTDIPIVITNPSSKLIDSLKQCSEMYNFAKPYLCYDEPTINIRGIILQKENNSSDSDVEAKDLSYYDMSCLVKFLKYIFSYKFNRKPLKYHKRVNKVCAQLIFHSKYYCENQSKDKYISFKSLCEIFGKLFDKDHINIHIDYIVSAFNSVYGTNFSKNEFQEEFTNSVYDVFDIKSPANKEDTETIIIDSTETIIESTETQIDAMKKYEIASKVLTDEDYCKMLEIFYINIVKEYINRNKDKGKDKDKDKDKVFPYVYMPSKINGKSRKYARFCFEKKSCIEELLTEMFDDVPNFDASKLYARIISINKEAGNNGEQKALTSNYGLKKITVGSDRVYVIYIPAEYYKP